MIEYLRGEIAELVFNKSNIQGLVEKLKSIYAKILFFSYVSNF